MKALLLLPLFATSVYSEKLAQADLAKLNDPDRSLSEISRLLIGPDREGYSLIRYQFLKANQPGGKPPLHILCGEREYISTYRSLDEYEIEEPSELFGGQKSQPPARLQPSMDAIHKSVLFVFDETGNEIRPFGGDNYIDEGFIFDFDGDGILDRAGSTNYGLKEAEGHDIQMFELQSFERKPRNLLRVIYNWHPDSAEDSNAWTYSCTDSDGDGRPEISFRQKEGIQDGFVFKWDEKAGKFSAGEIPKGSHILVLEEGDSLKSVAAAGGLGYPLIGKGDDEDKIPAKSPRAPFKFKSLGGISPKDLAAFFNGKDRRNSFDGAVGSFPNTIPENLFSMQPKEAALALAEANRTAGHRKNFRLAIDDRNQIAPPSSGWTQYSWISSGCYSLSSELYAIRFGGPDPVLLHFGYNSIGVVGRNPWADQPANNARIVKLSKKEAAFFADTLFWLDRIRSKSLSKDDDRYSGSYSTADGHATVSLHPSDAMPQELASETAWATGMISGNWTSSYNREVFANLAGLLIRTGLPKMLGDRWETDAYPGRHSLTTPTEERLRDRLGIETREKLANDLSSILAMNSISPLPPAVITRIAGTAGDEALLPLLPELKTILVELPAESPEEKEYETLEKRFARDHFGDPLADEPQEQKDAYKRLTELREKLRFFRPAVLRDPLADSVEKLRLASDTSRLKQAVLDQSPQARWALSLLRRTEPDTWAILVTIDFAKAAAKEKQTIFSTIAAGHPPTATDMIPNFTDDEKQDLALEIASFHQENSPGELLDDVPLILEMVRDKNGDIYRRCEAIQFLSKVDLTEAQVADFTQLLLAEIHEPQKTEYGSGTLGYSLTALSALPNPEQHLDTILSLKNIAQDAFSEGFLTIEAMTRKNPDRELILADFLHTQFVKSTGMMNYHFIKALAFDLRSLAPDIAAFASESQDIEDGDGANYSGGTFKSPVGNRYHIAREITALWSEENPLTLARMWIAFVASHPGHFQSDDENTALRDIAEKHIRTLPDDDRKHEITSILSELPINEYYGETTDWIKSLSK